MKGIVAMYFFKFLEIFLKFVEGIHMPWTQNILKDDEIRAIMDKVIPGDILLVRAGGHLTSLFLDGFSHSCFVLNSNQIFDSKGIGVSRDDILSVLVGYTRAAILRPQFTPKQSIGAFARALYIEESDKTVPVEYNYKLVTGNRVLKEDVPSALTCTQLVRDIINHGREDFMVLEKRFGFMSIVPNDFYLATKKFTLIYEVGK